MLRALTIRQPWAWAIAAGHKRVENRSWSTAYRGPLAIHAGRVIETEAYARCERLAGVGVPFNLATGSVVAVSVLLDVVTHSTDPWFEGPYGWVLDVVRPVVPVPCVGRQSLFNLPHDVEDAVREQLRRRAPA